MICLIDMKVLLGSRGFCCNLFLTMEMVGPTSTDAKRVLTSQGSCISLAAAVWTSYVP